MFTTRDILFAGVVPFVLAIVVGFVDAMTRKGETKRLTWSLPLAVGGGFLVSYTFAIGWPAFPPRQTVDWMAYVGVAVTAVGLLDALVRLPLPGRAGIVALGLVLLASLLVRPLLDPARDTATEARVLVALATLVGTAWWLGGDLLTPRVDGRATTTVWFLTAAAVALLMTLSSSQKLGLAAGGVVSAAAGLTLVAWARPKVGVHPVLVLVVALLLVGVMVNSRAWVVPPPPLWRLGLVMLAPLMPWLLQLTPAKRWSPVRKTLASVGLAVIPIAVALLTAGLEFATKNAAPADGYYDYY